MKIYVASSWRNKYQAGIVTELQRLGHDVYDFKNPVPGNTGFSWKQVDPSWKSGETVTSDRYQKMLEHPIAKNGYRLDMSALEQCEACVYVLPCGRSASWEFGFAMGQNKLCFVCMFEPDEPDLMFKGAVLLSNMYDLTSAFSANERTCDTCLNRCMDMDMEPYCIAVNKPFGRTLCNGPRPFECGQEYKLWKPDVRRLPLL